MKLGIYIIHNLEPWKDFLVKEAFNDINDRSAGDYPPELVFHEIERMKENNEDCAVLFCLDNELPPDPAGNNVVGVLVMTSSVDGIGATQCDLWIGWIRKGYAGRPFDMALPLIEEWAKVHGCVKLRTTTRRNVDSYSKWIGKRGFVKGETVFRKALV